MKGNISIKNHVLIVYMHVTYNYNCCMIRSITLLWKEINKVSYCICNMKPTSELYKMRKSLNS